MASNGIRDRVAIVGMGCTTFGEHWDKGVNDLLVDSTKDALASAGIALADVDAFWLGTLYSGQSGLTLSRPLKIDYKPVSRLENYCATGSEAFRNACYAVASGAYDIAMAVGVEKLKDSGISGLPGRHQRASGRRAPLPRQAALREGALVRRRPRGRPAGSRLRLHDLPGSRRLGGRRLRPGRDQGPAPGARDGRGPRLLHSDRARADGRSRLRLARHRVEGSARRHVRSRRRAGREP